MLSDELLADRTLIRQKGVTICEKVRKFQPERPTAKPDIKE